MNALSLEQIEPNLSIRVDSLIGLYVGLPFFLDSFFLELSLRDDLPAILYLSFSMPGNLEARKQTHADELQSGHPKFRWADIGSIGRAMG